MELLSKSHLGNIVLQIFQKYETKLGFFQGQGGWKYYNVHDVVYSNKPRMSFSNREFTLWSVFYWK